MDKQSEIRLVILACFSIGMGAALTPLGEPLSTIVVSKLNEDFFYLLNLIGVYIIPGVIVFGIFGAFMVRSRKKTGNASNGDDNKESDRESYGEIIFRSFKIYLFVMALTFLGAGFQPFIEKYLLDLHPLILYWINSVSAILDNATFADADISPQ